MPYHDPDDQAEYQRLWMLRRRQAYLADKSCTVCGSTKDLEIDHIDKSTKTIPIASIWSLSLGNPVRVAELEKCQVLCSVHHAEKTKSERLVSDLCKLGHELSDDNLYTYTKASGKVVRECRTCKKDRRRVNYILSGR